MDNIPQILEDMIINDVKSFGFYKDNYKINKEDFDSKLKIKLFQENRKASFEAAKKFPKKKIETIINNIGCNTGSLKAANGSNCYIKGIEKIQ